MLDDDWMEVDVVTQSDILSYNNVDICAFKESPVGSLFRIQKTDTMSQLAQNVQKKFGMDVPPHLFQFIHRQNGSYRPDEYMDLNELASKHVIECVSSCSKFSQSKERWHLFMLDPAIPIPAEKIGEKLFLLFFKLYDPVSNADTIQSEARSQSVGPEMVRSSLRHIGHTLATFGEMIQNVIPRAKGMVERDTLNCDELDCFEEVSNTLVEDVTVSKTCRQQELQNGDILVVCEKTNHDMQELDMFYSQLRNQVSIEFRELAKPHEHGFAILLDKSLSCQEVTAAVAEHLQLEDASNLQFTSFAVPHDGIGGPGRTIPPPCSNQTLDDMRQFASRTSPCLCYKKSSQILLYEVLDVPVTEQLLQLTRDRDAWLCAPPSSPDAVTAKESFFPHERASIRDLLKVIMYPK